MQAIALGDAIKMLLLFLLLRYFHCVHKRFSINWSAWGWWKNLHERQTFGMQHKQKRAVFNYDLKLWHLQFFVMDFRSVFINLDANVPEGRQSKRGAVIKSSVMFHLVTFSPYKPSQMPSNYQIPSSWPPSHVITKKNSNLIYLFYHRWWSHLDVHHHRQRPKAKAKKFSQRVKKNLHAKCECCTVTCFNLG